MASKINTSSKYQHINTSLQEMKKKAYLTFVSIYSSVEGILTEQLWLEGGAVGRGEDTTIRDDKCRRRANPQIDRPPRPPRYVALIGTFRCTIGILSREWWNCSEHFQTTHNPGGNLGDPTISKPACAWNTCATCVHLRDTLHLMESYYGFNQTAKYPIANICVERRAFNEEKKV